MEKSSRSLARRALGEGLVHPSDGQVDAASATQSRQWRMGYAGVSAVVLFVVNATETV